MYLSRTFIAAALLGLAVAYPQEEVSASETLEAVASSTAAEGVPAPTGEAPGAVPGGMVATHVIQVGGPNGSLAFYPDNVQANVGDMIQFQFNPKNHSVAQSTFDQPCVPIQNIMPNKTDAFFSGYMPSMGQEGTLTYTIRVNDERPIWFYCTQGQHCQGGMVGAVNAAPSGNRTVEAFKALAAEAPENLTPGQVAGEGNVASPSGAPAPGASESAGGAGPGGVGPTGTGGADATGTDITSPAEQTTNSAPGRVSQSLLGLGLSALAAFIVL